MHMQRLFVAACAQPFQVRSTVPARRLTGGQDTAPLPSRSGHPSVPTVCSGNPAFCPDFGMAPIDALWSGDPRFSGVADSRNCAVRPPTRSELGLGPMFRLIGCEHLRPILGDTG